MIKFLKDRILPLFMVAWLGGLLPACINDDEDTATGPEKTDGFNISIAISAGEASTARAYDGGLDEEDGIGAENYININDLHIYAFSVSTDQNKNNLLLAQVYPKSNGSNVAMDPSVVQIGNMYYLKAELPYGIFSDPENQTFKLVAVANWRTTDDMKNPLKLSETEPWNDLVTKTYEKSYVDENDATKAKMWTPKDGDGIPMYGFRKVSLVGYSFKDNNEFNAFKLADIDMLRAMAKIEVIDNIPENVGGKIISVKILRYNTIGCVAPPLADTQTEDGTVNVEKANIPNKAGVVTDGSLSFEQYGKTFVAYLPEYDLTDSRDIVKVNIGDKEYSLSLSPYQNGVPVAPAEGEYWWNALLRNHIYRYTIVGVEEPKELTVKYTVCPWPKAHEINIPNFE